MDITPIDSSVIPAIKPEQATAANNNANAITSLIGSGAGDIGASFVELSPLAQLLAATVTGQSQEGNPSQTLSGNVAANANFQQLAEAATNFVNAFNSFQDGINGNSANSFETAFDSALLQAIHVENNQSGSGSVQSFINSLTQVGINFQEANNPTNPNQFQINMTALEAAYSSNPTQISTLLTNAFQGLSTIEQQLLLAQSAQTQDATQMTLQSANVVTANIAGNSAASTTNGASNPVNAALYGVTGYSALNIISGNTENPPANADAASASASAAAISPSNDNAADAAITASTMNPVMIDPMIALAVAAYRVGENIEHSLTEKSSRPTAELIPDIGETTKVEPIDSDTHKNTFADPRHQTTHKAATDSDNPADNNAQPGHGSVDVSV